MTEDEYHNKRNLYGTSDAPIEVIEEAIRKLDEQWQAQNAALAEIGELDDIE